MAKLESCPTCGNQTSENASQCPDCGEPLSPGWADTVRKQRNQKAEEAKRAAEGAKRAAIQAALVQKKAKQKKRLIWGSVFAVPIVLFFGLTMYGIAIAFIFENELRNLKETDPAEYQMRIQKLEAQVAKVPASDISENIRLYRELQKLKPDSARYADKFAHYRRKQREAEARTSKAKVRAEKKSVEVAERTSAEWYSGGTLLGANLASWSNSTNQNRLATSADIAAKLLEGRFSSMSELKVHALNLKICLDEVAVEPKTGSVRVNETAAACAVLLGWAS